jgi:hypothetical protein
LIGRDASIPGGSGPACTGKESVVRSRFAGAAIAAASLLSMALAVVIDCGIGDSAKRWLG